MIQVIFLLFVNVLTENKKKRFQVCFPLKNANSQKQASNAFSYNGVAGVIYYYKIMEFFWCGYVAVAKEVCCNS